MVYGFASQSGGAFRVHSIVGQGTRAEIWLPRAGTATEAPSRSADHQENLRHSKALKITERFRRVAPEIIQYQATWDDPLTYERAFTVSFPLTPLDGGELLPYDCHAGNMAIKQSLGAERAEDAALAADLAKGIKRERRSVQDFGAGVGGGAVPGCTPGAPAAAGGRGGRGGRGGAADTGESTAEK